MVEKIDVEGRTIEDCRKALNKYLHGLKGRVTVVSVETIAEPNPGLGEKKIRAWFTLG